MRKIILNIKSLLTKYEVPIIAASTSFYVIIALISLLTLCFQFYNYFSAFENNFFVQKLNKLIYNNYLENFITIFSLNSFTPFIFISLVWSSSKVLTGYNKACDMIYNKTKKRNYFLIRLSSFLMFLILSLIFIIEIFSLLGAYYLVNKYFHSIFIYIIIDLFLTILLIFSLILILYIYLPPIIMSLKKAYFGAMIVSVVLYFMFVMFISFIQIYQKINPNFGIISLVSTSSFFIYLMNYVIIIGLIINKKRNEENI